MADQPNMTTKAVEIPAELYEQVAVLAVKSEFESAEAFIQFVLQEVVNSESQDFTPEEEDKVRERLENLGYL